MDSEQTKFMYFLTKVKNLGGVRIKSLLSHFGNAEKVFNLTRDEIIRLEGFNDKIASGFEEAKSKAVELNSEFSRIVDKAQKMGIKIYSFLDPVYPANLKNIYDAPPILYVKGNLTDTDIYSVGIVGTRFPSEYGKSVCKKITEELSALKIPVISGMALGIDSTAHVNCILNKNVTYAVLGSGVDHIYPYVNKKLYEKIVETGAIISEFDIGAKPDKVNFPRRNRIISGISLGTLIVETGIKGGSRITASFALDQNREVFAVPGNIYSKKSEGCNDLIKKGQAKLVMTIDDILMELDYKLREYIKTENGKAIMKAVNDAEMTVFEKKIYDCLNTEPIHIDGLSEISGLSISDCLVNLLTLEFKGFIKQLPGKVFIKI